MPRINGLTPDQKINSELIRITRETRNNLKDAGITYTDIARLVDKTPAAISRQFAKGNHITTEVFVASKMLLEGKI